MEAVKIIMHLQEDAILPTYTSTESIGFDIIVHSFHKVYKGSKEVPLSEKMLNSISKGFVFLRPFERLVVDTGIKKIEVPEGYHVEIRSKTNLALSKGLIVANQPGIIDADYNGPLRVVLYNSTPYLNKVIIGMKVAQGIIVPHIKPELGSAEEIS